jgi:hypothetical protein
MDVMQKFEADQQQIDLTKLYQPRCVVNDDADEFSDEDDQ